LQAREGIQSFVRVNKVTSGWTWSVQAKESVTLDELRELKEKALAISDELLSELIPQPEEPAAF
jgi:hypothetical protein